QKAPVHKRPAPPAAQPAGPSLLDRIGEYWWLLIIAGLLVVIGLVVANIRRRRGESSAASLDSIAPLNFDQPRAAAAATVPRGRDRADSFVVEDHEADEAGDDFEIPVSKPVTARRTEVAQPRAIEPESPAPVTAKVGDETMSSETQVRFDQQDALAEA